MCKQFMQGSALSSFIAKAGTILVDKKAEAIVARETARDNYPAATAAGHIAADFNALRAAAVTATTHNTLDYLNENYGPEVVKDSSNEVVKNLLPNKTLQRVKRYLRREARKPIVSTWVQSNTSCTSVASTARRLLVVHQPSTALSV